MRRLSMGALPRYIGLLTTFNRRVDKTTSVLMTFSTCAAVTLGSCTSLRTCIATSGNEGRITRLALRSSKKPVRNFFSKSIVGKTQTTNQEKKQRKRKKHHDGRM